MRRHRTVVTGALLATALGIGPAAAPAQAALPMSNDATYHEVAGMNSVYLIDVQGVVTMSSAAAQDSINHGYTVALRYWGDDPEFDDLLFGPITAPNVFAAADGLHYQYNRNFTASELNEDDSVASGYYDEIYVGARLLDAKGNTVALAESDRLTDNFV